MESSDLIYHREYVPFLRKLLAYEEAGVKLTVEGSLKTPYDIAELCVMRERGSYMGDYICNNSGRLVELRFDRIK